MMIDYSPDDIVHRCARCDSAEDRVNGFCSVECEDMADVERQRDEARDLACCLLSLHSFSERDVREAWASWRADDDPESEEMAAPLRELIHELLHIAFAKPLDQPPTDNGPGALEIGTNERGEVVMNLPRDMTGHIVFSPDEAEHLSTLMARQAVAARESAARQQPPGAGTEGA
jgi:hypothetical protein